MKLSDAICYQALTSHDRRFDGVFFTCVTSTGVYCRPVCPAIIPKRDNCRFVSSSIEAEKAGFRPCLRCRPELAPAMRRDNSPAQRLAAYIDETLLMDETLGSITHVFGMSERQLRRLFTQTFGIEPRGYAMSRRLLFAKQLLQDTALPITDIAYAAGFGSRGRLTINMQKHYGFTPERFRKEVSLKEKTSHITLRVDYRPPFDWPALLSFLSGRATDFERIENGIYHRKIGKYEISVRNIATNNHLVITMPVELTKEAHSILMKVRHIFDLDANPLPIAEALSRDPFLATLVTKNPGLRVPGCWENFETLLRTILGQQVSVAGASTLMHRFVTQIGVTPDTIARATPAQIAAIGMPLRRAETIWRVADLTRSGGLDLDERNPELFYNQLIAIPGIGPWTAEYLQMRVMRWPDAFPAGDLGLQKAVTPGVRMSEKQLRFRAEIWRPWRSYAVMLLWKSLQDNGG